MKRALVILASFATLCLAPAAVGSASLPDIEDEVMCPICGTMLELSEAPQAERERAFIRRLIAEGRSKEQIKDELVAEYGPEVLAVPDTEGFDLIAWLLPGAALLITASVIVFALRRWRHGGDDDPAPATEAAAAGDRLDEDRARYDL